MGDPIDVLLIGESLGAGIAVCGGVVNGLSSTVDLRDPLSLISFIDPAELLCLLSLCLSSVPGILIELFCDLNDGSRGFPSSPWNVESSVDFSWWKLWCGLSGWLWGSGRLCRNSYGFVPVYGGRVFCGSPAIWVFSQGEEGRVG